MAEGLKERTPAQIEAQKRASAAAEPWRQKQREEAAARKAAGEPAVPAGPVADEPQVVGEVEPVSDPEWLAAMDRIVKGGAPRTALERYAARLEKKNQERFTDRWEKLREELRKADADSVPLPGQFHETDEQAAQLLGERWQLLLRFEKLEPQFMEWLKNGSVAGDAAGSGGEPVVPGPGAAGG